MNEHVHDRNGLHHGWIRRRSRPSRWAAITLLFLVLAPLPAVAQQRDATPDGSGDDRLADLGVVGPGEYESPTWGYALGWSDEWEVWNDDLAVTSANLQDRITLTHTDHEILHVSLNVWGGDTSSAMETFEVDAPEGILDWFIGKEERDADDVADGDVFAPLVNEIDDGTAIQVTAVSSAAEGGSLRVRLTRLVADDEGYVTIQLLTPVSDAVDIVESAAGITFDGEPITDVLGDRDIDDLVGAAETAFETGSGDPTVATADDPLQTIADDVSIRQGELRWLRETLDADDVSDADYATFRGIIEGWADADDLASDLEDDGAIGEAYAVYVATLGDISADFDDFLEADEGSTEEDDAWQDVIDGIDDADDQGDDLMDLLADAGYVVDLAEIAVDD